MRCAVYSPSMNLIAEVTLTDTLEKFFINNSRAKFIMEPDVPYSFIRSRAARADNYTVLEFEVEVGTVAYGSIKALAFIVTDARAAEKISQSEPHRKEFIRQLENVGCHS